MITQYQQELTELEKAGRLRELRTFTTRAGCYIEHNGKKLVNLSSNDYLGLATNPEILKQFYSQQNDENIIDMFGTGSSSSRLMTATSANVVELENIIGNCYRKDALVFNSGYHANIGILPALTDKNCLIVADKLCHASIIDGLKLCGAKFVRFKHCYYEHCENILAKEKNNYKKIFIVTESIFSMDGDIADLQKLVALKQKYDAFLYVDEAHAIGVRGKNGLGICEEQNVINETDLIIGTFGKALASIGAFVAAHPTIKKYLINKMRSFIFTTALPPVIVNWNIFVFTLLQQLDDERVRLQELSDYIRANIVQSGLKTGGSSHIIPIITGTDKSAVELSGKMLAAGYLAQPIRPPTVPPGTSRVRLSLSSNMQKKDFENLNTVLRVP